MSSATTSSVVQQIGSLFDGGSVVGLTDRELIERFNDRRDAPGEAAFAALVARHGPMVLSICRQVLGDRHDAEDAFQAVFLVLARKARSIRDPDLLGNWLYGVALRTARKARIQIVRRRRIEEAAMTKFSGAGSGTLIDQSAPMPEHHALAGEQAELLYREIDRLPRPFRLPVVLCYFEGLTPDEAADRLRCPAGTVRSRLARACDKLRRGLTRRGVVLSAAALAAALDSKAAWASISAPLCNLTARAAADFVAGKSTAGAISISAMALAQEVLSSMLFHKMKLAVLTLLFFGAIASGAGFVGQGLARQAGKPDLQERQAGKPDLQKRQAGKLGLRQIAAASDDVNAKPAPGRMFVIGRVLDSQRKPVANAVTMVYAALKQPGRRTNAGWRPEPIGTARSDSSGRFQVDAPRTSSARHHLVGAIALAPGFGSGWVDLDADTARDDVDITLRPERLIQGRLFDVNGRPVQGVAVRVETMGRFIPANRLTHRLETIDGPSFASQNGNGLPAWPMPAVSDAEGRFTIHGAGQNLRVILAIDDPRFARQSYPIDTASSPSSEPVKLALEPAQIIKGRVTDASTGKPAPHAGLVITSWKENRGTVDEFEADDEGRFRANPHTASQFQVVATAPNGQPNSSLSKSIEWPKGAIEYSVDLALPRGALIHGRIAEEKSGKPVAGARISFGGRRAVNDTSGRANVIAESEADGSFELPVSPGPGYLIVIGPTDDFVLRAEDSEPMIPRGTNAHRRFYAHAFIPCHPKTAGDRVEVHVALRQGVTLHGQVIGPDRQPIRNAIIISPLFLKAPFGSTLVWSPRDHGDVKNGRFEVHGLDPDGDTPLYFLDPDHELGTTMRLSGKSSAQGSVVVDLERCGAARARLLDRAGKPIAGYRGSSLLAMVVTPGPYPRFRRPEDSRMSANVATINAFDSIHYADGPVSDSLGRITFPALIPGTTYRRTPRNAEEASDNTEFTVRPGETLDLGDLVIEERRR